MTEESASERLEKQPCHSLKMKKAACMVMSSQNTMHSFVVVGRTSYFVSLLTCFQIL